MFTIKTIVLKTFYIFVALNIGFSAMANHGPGAARVGSQTTSAKTLSKGKWGIGFEMEYTEFDSISRTRLISRGERAGGLDVLDRTFLYTGTVSYGVTDDLSLEVSLGGLEANDFREAELEDGEVEILGADPDGLTDLWIKGKYRFFQKEKDQFAFFGGIKIPTGENDIKNDEGEKLEAVEQPGSGAVDFLVGLAGSRQVTDRLNVDLSGGYIFRTEGPRDFEVGDRIDVNAAVSYVLSRGQKPHLHEDGQTHTHNHPALSLGLELNFRHLLKDKEDGNKQSNSGGSTLFLTPNINIKLNETTTIYVAAPIPVAQDLNGRQQETDVKVLAGITLVL